MAAVDGNVLLDRFVENAIELDVDALCDGEDVYIGAVMQHVEEAGVHSGDSACVLPAPSLTLAAALEVEHVVKRLGPALGVVGILNVQLAIADTTVYVLEVNPRASRTVPFASKAIGVNLVDAACRLAAGATLRELDLPMPRPTQVSVKAAVLPFSRFPGADPVLGPEMRSTGEVMASAADLPTALAKAERAAGRPLPTSGTAFLSVRDEDKPAAVAVAAALAGLGFDLVATEGTARTLRAAGLAIDEIAKVADADEEEETVVDLVRNGRCDLVINTPQGSGARADGYLIREAALVARVPVRDDDLRSSRSRPCDRERAGGVGALAAGAHRDRGLRCLVTLCHLAPVAHGASAWPCWGARPSAPYSLLRLDRGGLDPGIPGQFFMLEAPGRVLPRPMSLCQAPPGELAFLVDPIGPGTRALCSLEPDAAIHVLGPLGNGFDLSVERPLLVAGGIGIAPMPYLASTPRGRARDPRVPQRAPRRGRFAAPGRRGRRRAAPRHRAPARRPRRRPRMRARADARGRSSSRSRRAARLGGADGLRLRRLLRLRRGARGPLRAPLHRRPRPARRRMIARSSTRPAASTRSLPRRSRGTLDAFVTKTVTPLPREGNPPPRDRRDGERDAELDRPAEPRHRRIRRGEPAAARRSRCADLGLGGRLLRRPTTRTSATGSTRRTTSRPSS